jgi:hypothetical protein
MHPSGIPMMAGEMLRMGWRKIRLGVAARRAPPGYDAAATA